MQKKNILIAVVLLSMHAGKCFTQEITEGLYENRPHFIIKTANATYYYDEKGGGFSRMIDKDGQDWIAFKTNTKESYPFSAANSYRGIPQMGVSGLDAHIGHAGFDVCTSKKVNKNSIITTSLSGKWQWIWTFTDQYAKVTIEKNDTTNPYYFLYEGPIAGRFAPSEQYWGTSTSGPRRDMPDHTSGEGDAGFWQWVYFGDDKVSRVIFLAQQKADHEADVFSYLGSTKDNLESADGMVVFGFGRPIEGPPTIKESGNTFFLGFIEIKITDKESYNKIKEIINELILTK